MILPQVGKRRQNDTLKYCQEPGCGKEYLGHPITKYCEVHRQLKNRAPKREVHTPIEQDNIIIKHSFTSTTIVVQNCGCCGAEYKIRVIPRQKVYSKYCDLHTNSYKREHYEKTKN